MKNIKIIPRYKIGEKVFYWGRKEKNIKRSEITEISFWVDEDSRIYFEYHLASGETRDEDDIGSSYSEMMFDRLIEGGFKQDIFKIPTKKEIEEMIERTIDEGVKNRHEISMRAREMLDTLKITKFAEKLSKQLYEKIRGEIIEE